MWRCLADGLSRLYAACFWLAGAALITLCALVIYSIIARIIGVYGGGASEVAGYMMAAATFLALAPTFRAGGHIYVALVVNRLSPPHRRFLLLAAHGIMVGVTAYTAFYLSRLTYFSYQFEERSEGADAVLLWIPQLPTAIGAIIFAVSVLHSGVEVWLQKQTPPPPSSQPQSQPPTKTQSQKSQ